MKKGESIWLPLHMIHLDPDYWKEPEKFDPERFSDENKKNIKQSSYLPFGIGPRGCVGNLNLLAVFIYLNINFL